MREEFWRGNLLENVNLEHQGNGSNIRMYIGETCCENGRRMELAQEMYLMVGFGISGVEPTCSASTVLVLVNEEGYTRRLLNLQQQICTYKTGIS